MCQDGRTSKHHFQQSMWPKRKNMGEWCGAWTWSPPQLANCRCVSIPCAQQGFGEIGYQPTDLLMILTSFLYQSHTYYLQQRNMSHGRNLPPPKRVCYQRSKEHIFNFPYLQCSRLSMFPDPGTYSLLKTCQFAFPSLIKEHTRVQAHVILILF